MSDKYKLMSYNTSWVNDCSNNQLHGFLSESASIVAKANYMYNNDNSFINDLTNNSLANFRMILADKSTDYIASKMTEGYDFIALIEQLIHVPTGTHANYDSFTFVDEKRTQKGLQQDIGNNIDFGILRRMNMLKSQGLTDVSVVPTTDQTIAVESTKYGIVYDHIVHTIEGFGEGIGIIFKQGLIDTPLSWKKNSQPIYQVLAQTGGVNENIGNLKVRYYSDDLGKFVAPKANINDPILSKQKANSVADLARPIIMTAGIKGNTLNIFVAFHGPNILNLWYWGTKKKIIEVDTRKQLKDLLTDSTFSNQITDIFNFIAKGISDFINEGLAITLEPETSVGDTQNSLLSKVNKVNVFLGGDANDPNGTMLNSLLKNGLSIKVKGQNKPFPVKFTYPITLNEKLLTCCANADSVKNSNKTYTLGNVDKATLDRLKGYPDNFFQPVEFAYYGDYALFGSNVTHPIYSMQKDNNPLQQYTIEDTIEDTIGAKEKTVIASDHLPVISTVNLTAIPEESEDLENSGGGGRRKTVRRNKRTNKRMRPQVRITRKRRGHSKKHRKNSRK